MQPCSYLGLNDFKEALGTTLSTHDATYRAILEGVTRQIDDDLDRTFQPYQGTRYYTAREGDHLDVEDLLSVDAIRLDLSQDRTYNTSLTTSDWELGPYNAAAEKRPYTRIDIRPNGKWRFFGGRRGNRVDGTWGYWQDLAAVSAMLSTSLAATSTSLPLAGSASLQPGQTVLIGSEQVYLNSIDTSSNALVERAVNGTTAASHTTSEQIQVYRYPGPVVQATKIQALRIAKRPDAPFGVTAGGLAATEMVIRIPKLDPDVEALLMTYRRYRFLAV